MSTAGAITSSVGSFGAISTVSNAQNGQNLGAPTGFTQVRQWLTASIATAGVTPLPTSSIRINAEGWYQTLCAMSFSGSVGIYTFAFFQNGVIDSDCQLQQTLDAGQSFPRAVTIHDLMHCAAGDLIDVRVKCTNAGANFQLSNGMFHAIRIIG